MATELSSPAPSPPIEDPSAAQRANEWVRCRPWIEVALEQGPGLQTIENVERLIAERIYVFWAGKQSAAVTEIVTFPGCTALVVRVAGGDRDELTNELEPMLSAFGREFGCKKIIVEGDDQWRKPGEAIGYRPALTVMIKELWN